MLDIQLVSVNDLIPPGLAHMELLLGLRFILISVEVGRKFNLCLNLPLVTDEHTICQADADGELAALLRLVLVDVVWPDGPSVKQLAILLSAV